MPLPPVAIPDRPRVRMNPVPRTASAFTDRSKVSLKPGRSVIGTSHTASNDVCSVLKTARPVHTAMTMPRVSAHGLPVSPCSLLMVGPMIGNDRRTCRNVPSPTPTKPTIVIATASRGNSEKKAQ